MNVMFKRVTLIICTVFVFFLSMPFTAASATQLPQDFAFSNSDCGGSFFGLEPWYYYLPQGEISDGSVVKKCDIRCFNLLNSQTANDCGNKDSDLPYVLLAIIDDLLRIAGLLALGFIIYGAFKFVGSQGSPEGSTEARNTIVNALIGLAIASVAVVLVNYLGNTFG